MSTPTCTGRIAAALGFNWSDDAGSKNAGSAAKVHTYNTAGAVSNVVYKEYTITASGTQAIDFSGSLTDFAGNTITWTKLVGMMIYHGHLISQADSSASSISFGPRNGTNPVANVFGAATHTLTLKPGCFAAMGWPVDNAITLSNTADNFLLTNNDGSNSAKVTVAFLGDD